MSDDKKDDLQLACEVIKPPTMFEPSLCSLRGLLVVLLYMGLIGFMAWHGARMFGGGW